MLDLAFEKESAKVKTSGHEQFLRIGQAKSEWATVA